MNPQLPRHTLPPPHLLPPLLCSLHQNLLLPLPMHHQQIRRGRTLGLRLRCLAQSRRPEGGPELERTLSSPHLNLHTGTGTGTGTGLRRDREGDLEVD